MTISSGSPSFSTLSPTNTWTATVDGSIFTEWTTTSSYYYDSEWHTTTVTDRTTTDSDGSVTTLSSGESAFTMTEHAFTVTIDGLLRDAWETTYTLSNGESVGEMYRTTTIDGVIDTISKSNSEWSTVETDQAWYGTIDGQTVTEWSTTTSLGTTYTYRTTTETDGDVIALSDDNSTWYYISSASPVTIDSETFYEWTTTITDSTGATFTVTDRTTTMSGETYTISSSSPSFSTLSPTDTWTTTFMGSTFQEWSSYGIDYRTTTDYDGSIYTIDSSSSSWSSPTSNISSMYDMTVDY